MPLKLVNVLTRNSNNSLELNAAISKFFHYYEIKSRYSGINLNEKDEDPEHAILYDYILECGFTDKDVIILDNNWEYIPDENGAINLEEANIPIRRINPIDPQIHPLFNPNPEQVAQAWGPADPMVVWNQAVANAIANEDPAW